MRCDHDCFHCRFRDCVVERATPVEIRQIEAFDRELTGRKLDLAESYLRKMEKQKIYNRAYREKRRRQRV